MGVLSRSRNDAAYDGAANSRPFWMGCRMMPNESDCKTTKTMRANWFLVERKGHSRRFRVERL